jgi:hypothetical protein
VGARRAFTEPRGSSCGGDAPIPTFPQRGKEKCTLRRFVRSATEKL